MTTVTTLKGHVSGDFPFMTKYGIIKYLELSQYLSAMDKCGYTFSPEQINALTNFYKMGHENGWINKLLYVMPFIGNSSALKAAAVPMIDRFAGYSPALTAVSGGSYPSNDNYANYFKKDSGGNILAAVPYTNSRALVMNVSIYDLFVKTPDCSNQNNGNYGIDWYGNITTPGSISRICQSDGWPVLNYLGFLDDNRPYQEWFGRIASMPAIGTAMQENGAIFFSENIKPNSKNIMEYRAYDKTISTLLAKNETAERDDYTELTDVELAKTLTFAVNASWNATTGIVSRSNVDSGLETRYLAFHDGTLDANDGITYRSALSALLQTFNKTF